MPRQGGVGNAPGRCSLLASRLLTQHLERDVAGRSRQFGVLDPTGGHLDGQPFGVS